MEKVEELIIASLKELLDLRCITNLNSDTKSKLVYPLKRDGTRRISKQEAKTIFVKHLEQTNGYYYSIKAPTRKEYVSTGSIPALGSIDVCLYEDGKRKHLIEFKALNPRQDSYSIAFEKLYSDEEDLDNYFIHLLQKTNKGTILNVESKYIEAIENVREKYTTFQSRLKIFLCEIEEKKITLYDIDEDGKLSSPNEIYKLED